MLNIPPNLLLDSAIIVYKLSGGGICETVIAMVISRGGTNY